MGGLGGLDKRAGGTAALADLLGESRGIIAVREKVTRLLERQFDARRLPSILIQGETGTGKGLLARAIHRAGPRAGGPFVNVNCAAIPETLLEAELFGFERGAFTDARQAKAGLFQTAHQGTLFLDEVGLLPEALQGKLLSVLEERSVRRLGSTRSEPVDMWVLAATSADLEAETRARRFREDLYHRLVVVTLQLPPLRERGRDMLLLAEHFLARACADYGLPPKTLASDACAALLACRWPGNIRELANVMERVALLSDETTVTAALLGLSVPAPADVGAPAEAREMVPLEEAMGSAEREHLLEALRETNWNISRAAARLGISRNTLRYRIEKYGLRPGVSPPPPQPAPPARPAKRSEAAPAPNDAGRHVSANSAPPVVRWERRRLTLLRVVLIAPSSESPGDTNRALEEIVEKARSFGGRVEDMSSTGVIAAFGLEPMEDAPWRAALAARAILKEAERSRQSDGERLAAVAGIHVAQFLVGQVGGSAQIDLEGKLEAWAVLDALAERAAPNSIVISEAVVPFLERRFDLISVSEIERVPGRAYRLGGREEEGLAPKRQISQFVARHHELELLQGRSEAAKRGHGQVVGIAGEPGIGKSRLLFEFRQSLVDQRITYLEGHCVSYGSTIPYLPILHIVRASFRIAGADTPEVATEKVRAGLRGTGTEPTEWVPYLLHLLGLKDGTDRLALLTPEVIKARSFEALRQLSIGLSRQSPVIIVVEDLHWIDGTSEEFLAALAEAIPLMRILLITTYRFGYRPPWIEKSYATQLALQPLAQEESLRLVRSTFGANRVADSMIDVVLTKAEGNPFFLEEMARAVQEQGGVPGRVGVPDTIQDVLLARINRLPQEEKRLLQSASIIGKDVPLSVLQAIVELPQGELRHAVMRLQADEFLYEISAFREPEYTFKHALTHEVAYESLLPEQRRALHSRVVEAIERLYPDRLTEHVERLAHHAFCGELWQKAVTYLFQAGAQAASRSANREAVALLEQALTALKHLPESRATVEQAIDIRLELRRPLVPLGGPVRIVDLLREAEALATALGDDRRLGWVCLYMTHHVNRIGDRERALACGRRALAIGRDLSDFGLQVVATAYLGGYVHFAGGEYRQAKNLLSQCVLTLRGDLVHHRFDQANFPSGFSRSRLAWCLAHLGEFVQGTLHAEESVRIAETADQPYSLSSACLALGSLYLLKGDLAQAIPVLERGVGLCRTWNILANLPNTAASLGYAYALSGRVAGGLPLLQEAIEKASSARFVYSETPLLGYLSEAYLLDGRSDDALPLAQRDLDQSHERGYRGHEAHAHRLLGEIVSCQDPPDVERAEGHYRRAMTLADELGMRPLLAHCHLGVGRLYGKTDNRAKASAHLTTAATMYREMDMAFWLQKAEAALGPPHRNSP